MSAAVRWVALAVAATLPVYADNRKLSDDERIELVRGLAAEFATAKVLIPRSKKTLSFPAAGGFDSKVWAEKAKEVGPAARAGDLVQITKVNIEGDKIVLELNNGAK